MILRTLGQTVEVLAYHKRPDTLGVGVVQNLKLNVVAILEMPIVTGRSTRLSSPFP